MKLSDRCNFGASVFEVPLVNGWFYFDDGIDAFGRHKVNALMVKQEWRKMSIKDDDINFDHSYRQLSPLTWPRSAR